VATAGGWSGGTRISHVISADGSPMPVRAESPKIVPVSGKVADHGRGTSVCWDFCLCY
jgi:hypothetical protein